MGGDLRFQSLSSQVSVDESELARFRQLCLQVTLAYLDGTAEYPLASLSSERNLRSLNFVLRLGSRRVYLNELVKWLESSEPVQLPGDVFTTYPLEVIVNTAISLGSDCLRFAARILAQSPNVIVVDHASLRWFARLVRNLYIDGFLTRGKGWERVVTFLEKVPGPIVIADHDFPSAPEEFASSIIDLRATRHKAEIEAVTWSSYYYNNGWDAAKLNALSTMGLDRAAATTKEYMGIQLPPQTAWRLANENVAKRFGLSI